MAESNIEKPSASLIVQALMTLLVALGLYVSITNALSGQFGRIHDDITGIQSEIASIKADIVGLDNKINAIGDMTVVAFADGEITGEELVLIWDRATSQSN